MFQQLDGAVNVVVRGPKLPAELGVEGEVVVMVMVMVMVSGWEIPLTMYGVVWIERGKGRGITEGEVFIGGHFVSYGGWVEESNANRVYMLIIDWRAALSSGALSPRCLFICRRTNDPSREVSARVCVALAACGCKLRSIVAPFASAGGPDCPGFMGGKRLFG